MLRSLNIYIYIYNVASQPQSNIVKPKKVKNIIEEEFELEIWSRFKGLASN
jgi:hypothetical protein